MGKEKAGVLGRGTVTYKDQETEKALCLQSNAKAGGGQGGSGWGSDMKLGREALKGGKKVAAAALHWPASLQAEVRVDPQ